MPQPTERQNQQVQKIVAAQPAAVAGVVKYEELKQSEVPK